MDTQIIETDALLASRHSSISGMEKCQKWIDNTKVVLKISLLVVLTSLITKIQGVLSVVPISFDSHISETTQYILEFPEIWCIHLPTD